MTHVGLLLLKLGEAAAACPSSTAGRTAVDVELLVDAPKRLRDRARDERDTSDDLRVGDDLRSRRRRRRGPRPRSDLRRRLDARAVHPAHEGARVDSTTDLTIFARTLLISGSGGETCTSGAESIAFTLKSAFVLPYVVRARRSFGAMRPRNVWSDEMTILLSAAKICSSQ